MGDLVGYSRVSSQAQSLDIQIQQLTDAGCRKVFAEKKSGTNLERPEWERCFNYIRDGDTLMVTRLDRLARSMGDLFKIIEGLKQKNVQFRVLHQPEIDTTTANGRLVLAILGAIAEFETEVRKSRQREGIEAARERGAYVLSDKSKKKMWASRLLNQGFGMSYVSTRLSVPRRTLYDWFPDGATGKHGVKHKKRSHAAKNQTHPPSAAEAVGAEATPETSAGKPGFFERLVGR